MILMTENLFDIQTPDGLMPTWVIHPDQGGPFPLIMFWMDALGIREELIRMARRFAEAGYAVYLPNLFYRDGGPSFDTKPLAHGILDPWMMQLNESLSLKMTLSDCGVILKHAEKNPNVHLPGAVIGYCMGGRHAMASAAAYPSTFKAMASMHGGRLVNDQPDSPHLCIPQIEAEIYFAWADEDPSAPASHAEVIEALLKKRPQAYELEWHKGALHGFTFPERFCYHREAAERVWSKLFDLFERQLKSQPNS